MIKLNENNGAVFNDDYFTKEDFLNLFRLQKQLLIEENIVSTLEECANIWQNYSWDLSASWLFFPDRDEDILKQIKSSDHFDSFENYSL